MPDPAIGPLVMRWVGKHSDALSDVTTREMDIEGAVRSGKTTVCLWREYNAAKDYPGIHILLARWTDSGVYGLVTPLWAHICSQAGLALKWHADEEYYQLENGSRVYVRGLKAQDQTLRYSKLRGLTLARVYVDQAEEIPRDIYLELAARLSQPGFPHQITISPQSVSENHWIAEEFPEDNHLPSRRYLPLSVHDNKHNLSPEVIPNLERLYPPGHPQHRTLILGQRGMSVIGDPVYKGAFVRRIHEGVAEYQKDLPLEMGLDFGKHHPCVIWRQVSPLGQVRFLGGILGQGMYLEDFLTVIQRYQQQWFPSPCEVRECCDPAGASDTSHGTQGALHTLKKFGIVPRYVADSNSPAIRLAMVERMAGQMRRRAADMSECFQVSDSDRWLRISSQATTLDRFLADGFEAGYVWDEHMVSVANKQVRKPKKDGWYEHGQNCFDSETDVLTDSGWRRFADLSDVDALATVNLDSDRLEYQRPSRLIRQEYEDTMLRLNGRLDALVTPEHRMVVYPRMPEVRRYNGPRPYDGPDFNPNLAIIRAAGDLDRFDRLKLTATWVGARPDCALVPRTKLAAEKELDPGDWAEFLGWYVAEGSYSARVKCPGWGYRVVVSQAKAEGRAKLEPLLDRLPWKWHRTANGYQASSEQLWRVVSVLGRSHDKCVPAWIRWAAPELIARFLDGAIAGDGHAGDSGHRQYFTASPMLADQMQELFIKVGRSASITRKPAVPYAIKGRIGANTVDQFHLNEWLTPAAGIRNSHSQPSVTEEAYSGMVYCATVPNGTLVVRRSGRPFIAGNCAEYLEVNFGSVPRPVKVPAPAMAYRPATAWG